MTCRESILFEYLKNAKRRRRRQSRRGGNVRPWIGLTVSGRFWPNAARLGFAGALALQTWVMRSLS